jgi:uncharacterized protein (TIGR02757 family)
MKNNILCIRDFLDEKVLLYNRPEFIVHDPVQIPHLFSEKEDIEIAGFLAATIAWGNRMQIISNAKRMISLMGNAPYDFVMHHKDHHLKKITGPIHRTFQPDDFIYFLKALRNIYQTHGGLEGIFTTWQDGKSLQPAIHMLKKAFFELPHPARTGKHIPDPMQGSAAKRVNLFLRWMVRKDNHGVDLGIWNSIPPSILSCPLDLHSGNVARKLGLLSRRQNDARAVTELDGTLRKMDSFDPVKYDFALFGLGIFENF